MNGQNPNELNNNTITNGGVLGTTNGPVGPTPMNNGSVSLGAVNQNPTNPTPNPTPNIAGNPIPNPSVMPNVAGTSPVNPTPVTPNIIPNPTAANPNVAPTSPVEPQAPVGPSPMPNQNEVGPSVAPTTEPVARPIPGTEGTPGVNNNLMGNTVGTGVPLGGGNINNFTDAKKTGDIGMVPPTNSEKPKKEKKPMNKTLFVVLIIALIALIAFGVYYLLSISSTKVKLTPKTVTLGVGEALPDKITDYASITKGESKNCSLNVKNVNTAEIGEYNYNITCGKDIYKGKVIVKDVTAPKVNLNIVFRPLGETVKVEDFVNSCTDPSECTTAFVNEETVKNYLTTAGGPYKVEISATDKSNNSITYDGSLYVTEYPVALYYNCSKPSEPVTGYQATKTENDVLPMGRGEDSVYYYQNVSLREYIYVFTSKDEYEEVTKNKESSISFDGNTGTARYDDENLTLTIITDLPKATINSEAAGAPINTFSDFYQLYNNRGYMCSNQSAYPSVSNEN